MRGGANGHSAKGSPGFAIMVSAATELEGSWSATEATIDGAPVPKIVGQLLSFKGDRFQIVKDGELLFGGGFSIDPSAKPSSIRFEQNETQTLAGTWLGIYDLAGDRLMICDNAPDMTKPRPEGFGDCAEPGYVLVHFTR